MPILLYHVFHITRNVLVLGLDISLVKNLLWLVFWYELWLGYYHVYCDMRGRNCDIVVDCVICGRLQYLWLIAAFVITSSYHSCRDDVLQINLIRSNESKYCRYFGQPPSEICWQITTKQLHHCILLLPPFLIHSAYDFTQLATLTFHNLQGWRRNQWAQSLVRVVISSQLQIRMSAYTVIY